jgi:hypothetical protein
LENGYADGWLDTLLEDIDVYPWPWSGDIYRLAACKTPGYPTEDSYSMTDWAQLKVFLWRVGIGLDTKYGSSASSVMPYMSDLFVECPPAICGISYTPGKLSSLLEARFRFRVIAVTSNELSRLDDSAETIRSAIDGKRPVLLLLSEGLLGNKHVGLIQGYRHADSGSLSRYDYLVNFGWGPNSRASWVPGSGSFDAGGFAWKYFWVIDVEPMPKASGSEKVPIAPLRRNLKAGGFDRLSDALPTAGIVRREW